MDAKILGENLLGNGIVTEFQIIKAQINFL